MPTQRISDRVYMVGGGEFTAPGDCSFYLIKGVSGKCILIDCGVGNGHERLVKNLAELGLTLMDIHTLVLTHCHIDHIGGAHRITGESKCSIVAHKDDSDAIEGRRNGLTAAQWYGVEYQPVRIDTMLVGSEERIDIGAVELMVIHTPGHTPGSIIVYFDDGDKRVLFGQDIHGPFDPAWGSDLDKWRSSMKKLLDLDADILCEGHFGVFKGKQAVRNYIQGYLEQY